MQDVDNKKTILGDDASIYQKKEDREESKSARETWRELDFKGKVRFFCDYYLLKLLLVLVVTCAVIYGVYLAVAPKPNEELYLVFLNCQVSQDALTSYFDDALVGMGYDPEESKITCNTSLTTTSPNDASTISTYLVAGTVDVLVGTKEALSRYYDNGFALLLDENTLPQDIKSALEEDDYLTVYCSQIDTTGPFGIRLNDTSLCKEAYPSETDLYLVVLTTSERSENAYRLIRYLLDLPQVAAPSANQ